MRDERDVVDGERQRQSGAERRGVGRREEQVQSIVSNSASEMRLFPPGAPAAADHAGRAVSGGSVQRQRLGSVENESPVLCVGARRPARQQFTKVAAHASRIAQQLARVDADPQRSIMPWCLRRA